MRKVIIWLPDGDDAYLAVKHVGVQLEGGFSSGYDPRWEVVDEHSDVEKNKIDEIK